MLSSESYNIPRIYMLYFISISGLCGKTTWCRGHIDDGEVIPGINLTVVVIDKKFRFN